MHVGFQGLDSVSLIFVFGLTMKRMVMNLIVGQ